MAGKAEIKYDPECMDPIKIIRLISDLGFGASQIDEAVGKDGVLDLSVSQ